MVCWSKRRQLTSAANSFTPWFKLIARDLLYPWWDEMLAKSKAEGSDKVRAGVLEGGDKVNELIKMV